MCAALTHLRLKLHILTTRSLLLMNSIHCCRFSIDSESAPSSERCDPQGIIRVTPGSTESCCCSYEWNHQNNGTRTRRFILIRKPPCRFRGDCCKQKHLSWWLFLICFRNSVFLLRVVPLGSEHRRESRAALPPSYPEADQTERAWRINMSSLCSLDLPLQSVTLTECWLLASQCTSKSDDEQKKLT